MGGFIDAALGFPAVVFSFALLVVIAYWVFAMLSGIGGGDLGHSGDAAHGPDLDHGDVAGSDVDGGGTDADHGGGHGFGGLLAAAGLGGVPVTVSLSLLIALTWFAALVATVLLGRLHDSGTSGALTAVVTVLATAAALVAGWLVTRLLVRPLRRMLPNVRPPSRHDFVGLTCVIRTGRVTADFGQAEVTSADGSSAVVQVRQTDDAPLRAGSTALIFDYDADGEFFRVMPYGVMPYGEQPVG
ncbi:hypothetical protein ACIQGZ_04260 [Streptomyces sp. NPDC092296]|uniref:hypothetical protein n=1 Tax=Streptomyces sp. NPDC092296 TaxID=3366012 RepID=UPI00381DF9FB